ncbi:MAG: class I SAM-dependent methyltransferase [candidate division Zixibacteria bacterium]|nr:class I SAM-dependent methyltransferase [candidate division Zixibacteria bacterium]
MNRIARFAIKYVLGVASTIYLFTIGWAISGRARGLITTICTHFGFAQDRLRVPTVELSELVSSNCFVRLVELPEHNGNITLQELSVIAALVRQNAPKTIFEIGTFDGRTTLNMAINSAPDTRIYTLDLPRDLLDSTKLHITTGDRVFVDKAQSGERFRNSESAHQVTQLYGDSATFDFSPYFGTIDLVFVDGSHAYDYVRNDTEIALKLLRDGRGVILWHDYAAWAGVTRALNEVYQRALTNPLPAVELPVFKNMRHISGTTLAYFKM